MLLEKQNPASEALLSRFPGRENYVLVQGPEAPFLSINQASHFLPRKVASRWWTTLAVLWWLHVWGGGPPGWQFHVAWMTERESSWFCGLIGSCTWLSPYKGLESSMVKQMGEIHKRHMFTCVNRHTYERQVLGIEHGDLYMLPCL